MSHNPALARTIPHRALGPVTRSSRGELAHIVPENTATPGLIESNPVLYLRPHGVEDHTRVADKVSNELLLVQKTAVALVQLIRHVPMEESDQGRDARLEQVIHKLDVVLQALWVDGVVAASEGNDAGPALIGMVSRRQSRKTQWVYGRLHTMRWRSGRPARHRPSTRQCPRGCGGTSRRLRRPSRRRQSCLGFCRMCPRWTGLAHLRSRRLQFDNCNKPLITR